MYYKQFYVPGYECLVFYYNPKTRECTIIIRYARLDGVDVDIVIDFTV